MNIGITKVKLRKPTAVLKPGCGTCMNFTVFFVLVADVDPSSSLRDQYIANRFPDSNDEWPPYQPKHYTTLALIYFKEKYADKKLISMNKELANQGKLRSAYGNATNNISELFTLPIAQASDSVFILIEGAPGIGKTILSKEIAY